MKLKKYREKAASFLVEGAKNVHELILSDYVIEELFVTEKFLTEFACPEIYKSAYIICSEKDLIQLGTFQTNEYALAVAKMKEQPLNISRDKLVLALDGVSDPGNLGTIVRIADWYGLHTILAGRETADFYNPKVINASMGSFTRIQIHYMDLRDFLGSKGKHRVYGAVLDGADVHEIGLDAPAILLIGNESNGISGNLLSYVDHRITIPRIGKAESLNVAVSTAIICDNFLRN